MSRFAVVHAGQLVTLRGRAGARPGPEMDELSIIEDGAMIVADGQIEAVGTTDELSAQLPEDVSDAGGRLVTPGLIDAHTHAVFGGCRANEFEMRCGGFGYQEIAEVGGGIRSSMRSTRAATEDELFELGRQRVQRFFDLGTTTIECKSGYGLTFDDELKMLRVMRRLDDETPMTVVPTLLAAHAIPPEFEGNREAYVNLICDEIIPAVVRRGLAKYVDAFCEDRYFTADEVLKIATTAQKYDLELRLHVDQLTNGGGAALAAELGAKTADHLEQTDEDGIRALAGSKTMPVLLPASVFMLGLDKYPDARRMIDGGLPVVLATDFNPGSSPTQSLPFVMTLACLKMGMSPAEALTACTVNAAASLDLAHDRGTLEAGKRADFAVWEAEDYREIPYWAATVRPHSVYVRGQKVG
ncbi:MAG: imidazolonepropionase [Fimbriimonadaceae bacterium]|nr:imidazolonepropionase [Fimbriimonadaceae bacterium]